MAKKKTRKDLEEAYNTSIQSRQLRLWQGAVIYEIVCLLTTMKGPWKMGPLRQRLVFHQDRFTAGSELIWLHRTEEKSCCWPQVISRVLIGFSLQLLPFFLSFFLFLFFNFHSILRSFQCRLRGSFYGPTYRWIGTKRPLHFSLPFPFLAEDVLKGGRRGRGPEDVQFVVFFSFWFGFFLHWVLFYYYFDSLKQIVEMDRQKQNHLLFYQLCFYYSRLLPLLVIIEI